MLIPESNQASPPIDRMVKAKANTDWYQNFMGSFAFKLNKQLATVKNKPKVADSTQIFSGFFAVISSNWQNLATVITMNASPTTITACL